MEEVQGRKETRTTTESETRNQRRTAYSQGSRRKAINERNTIESLGVQQQGTLHRSTSQGCWGRDGAKEPATFQEERGPTRGTSQHANFGEEEAAPLQITKRWEDADKARSMNTMEDADNGGGMNKKEDANNRGGANKEEDADNGGSTGKEGDADNNRVGDAEAEEDCVQPREKEEGNQREEHNREPWRPTAGNTTSEHILRPLGKRRCEGTCHVPRET
ncbi:hypothetical protein NDU88_004266 [Pleurodeles waltl]|uniref:Uncharacterized protein n=1 Tax=Pleurodeles waltl TaxID=8319 RepID=A0AAV7SIB3_PLEWA|nr:hypothetical protein NDU88_004266 [Pleurodeles waltl]